MTLQDELLLRALLSYHSDYFLILPLMRHRQTPWQVRGACNSL
jgi:hypothetical protein